MINQNMKRRMEMMSPAELKKFATLHKDDPFIVSMALDIDNVRKSAQRQQAMQAAAAPQMPVVDQNIAGIGVEAPEQQAAGIPTLPAKNIEVMADGGIAGYADGGSAKRDPLQEYIPEIVSEAQRQGVDPNLAIRLFKTESSGKKGAVSEKGATGLGQLMVAAAKEMGLSAEDRFDPSKNIRASIGYLKKQLDKYGDPVKAVAAYNWGPGNVDKHLKKNQGELNPVGLPKETADYITKLLPFSTARAGDERPSKPMPTGSVRDVGMTFPPSMLNPELRKPRSVAEKTAPEDVQYSPEGIPLTTPAGAGYPQTKSPVAAQLAGAADILPKALYGLGRTASENILALPFGRDVPVEKRRETAEKIMSPFYRYGTIGGLTGLAHDPAYGTDPATIALEKIVGENLEKSDAAIAAMTGANKENVRLIRENLMLAAPAAARIKPVETGMPKLPGKGKPTAAAAQAAEDAAAAQAAAEAAKAKVGPLRLAADQASETPGVISTTSEGVSTLPSGRAAAGQQRGLAALAEDLNAAKFREAQAAQAARAADEAAAAEAQVAGESRLRGRIDKAGLTTAGLGAATAGLKVPPGALEPETARTPYTGYGPSDAATDAYMTSGMGGYKFGKQPEKFDATTEEKPAAAAEKKGGFTDEDWLMMGLNMLQAQPGQPGGGLSQLMSNVGRSGLATLGAKKEREKTEFEKLQKQALTDYYAAMTKQVGQAPSDIRSLQALLDNPKLMEQYVKMERAKDETRANAALVGEYYKATLMNPDLSWNDFVQKYQSLSGAGDTGLFKVIGSRSQ